MTLMLILVLLVPVMSVTFGAAQSGSSVVAACALYATAAAPFGGA